MRKLLFALGAVCLLAGPASARHQPNQKTLVLHRSVFNTLGRSEADVKPQEIERLCDGRPADEVYAKRNSKDVFYSIFSLGFYTPMTVHVTCPTDGPQAFNR